MQRVQIMQGCKVLDNMPDTPTFQGRPALTPVRRRAETPEQAEAALAAWASTHAAAFGPAWVVKALLRTINTTIEANDDRH
jgi:hypothetical protein